MAARKPRARVTGIGGIFFKARDPKTLVEWYRRHLEIAIEGSVGVFTWRDGRAGTSQGHTVWSTFPGDTEYFATGGAPFMSTTG